MSRLPKADPIDVSDEVSEVGTVVVPSKPMTAFVESCVETVTGSAVRAQRSHRLSPTFGKLLHLLQHKSNILITTHRYPDPDALASGWALRTLLEARLPHAKVSFSIRDQLSGGVNATFMKKSRLTLVPWDESKLSEYDAILLTDVTTGVSYNPLPDTIVPFAVIDHHRTRRKPKSKFSDVRPDVGATSSIVFSYFMEAEEPISPTLAASLLYAIESDLAGAAGQPGSLDNMALSSLTLLADTRMLYEMRYVDLPQAYYTAYSSGLASAMYYENAITAHLDAIDSPEKPAVIADFLLRFEPIQWALVTAVYENRLVISLRTSANKLSAADMIRKLLRGEGDGGGHRTKAGGFIPLGNATPAEVERKRTLLRRRYLRALGIKPTPGKRLVLKGE